MTYSPFFIHGSDRTGNWLVTCDHATNTVPDFVNGGTLGLPEADMARHIAYDIGGQGVALALGTLLNAPVICSNFSRLVIDPNRGLDDPTLVMQLYDGTIIPGNRHLSDGERQARIDQLYQPYHDALGTLAARPGIAIVSVHSFTPQLNGYAPRPWEVGVLSAHDRRFADPLLTRLQGALSTPVGDNEPYGGHLPGDSIDQHALRHGRPNALLEVRQDLIHQADQQQKWAQIIAPHLEAARQDANL
ncbi:N-formylglutamate amidohydrolase [uncultured Tateyamaria sp.]|uniref:N-formylglutamate amidohydrolase n=1 Tax=uncultured Tateyamaria sp. TaxID=455651 RepID=UPI00260CA1F3|nr:N-formylglutamate amidohydrolase [uncultured Tateyamaria sp.]